MKARKNGFTLVELLVVIGIIAVLIGILLPALSKARDQANTVACASIMRQFAVCWQIYANQNNGHVLPARQQFNNVEYSFCDSAYLGSVLKANTGDAFRSIDAANIIKQLLTCPAANHDGDPTAAQIEASGGGGAYYGDYIYNTWMGVMINNNTTPPSPSWDSIANPKVSQVPSNVILCFESFKPNSTGGGSAAAVMSDGKKYSNYFQTLSDLFLNPAPPLATMQLYRTGTPHRKGTRMNVNFADGHVALIDPRVDLFMNKTQVFSARYYLWGEAKKLGSGAAVANWPAPASSNAGPVGLAYWNKSAQGF